MSIKKLCSYTGCHKVVDEGIKYCIKHERVDKERYKEYQARRLADTEEKKYQEFYESIEWRRLRKVIALGFLEIDILEYYTTGRIVQGERVHHIVELREDWNSRLDIFNLIYLTEKNHRKVHAIYERSERDKKAMQNILFKLIDRFNKEFN
jgi:5-methylcytosine-specific restriction enzyme A